MWGINNLSDHIKIEMCLIYSCAQTNSAKIFTAKPDWMTARLQVTWQGRACLHPSPTESLFLHKIHVCVCVCVCADESMNAGGGPAQMSLH